MKSFKYYKDQTIRPGKFEGENPLTVYLWEVSMDGDGEIVSDPEFDSFHAVSLDLTSEEMETFGTEIQEWVLIEDSQGFVFSIPFEKFSAYAGRED